jgi:hypothetical protein
VTAFVEDLRTRQVTPHIAVDGRVSKLGVVRKTVCRGQWMVLEAAAPSAAASTEPRDAPQTSLGTPSKWRRTGHLARRGGRCDRRADRLWPLRAAGNA